MNIDNYIQDLSIQIYENPLLDVHSELDYPNLNNPLHLITLFIDCDTEIDMNGFFGYLENSNGKYLPNIIEALGLINSIKTYELFKNIKKCMDKYNVTWEKLRNDFKNSKELEITTFEKLHGQSLKSFSSEINQMTKGISLFNTNYSLEDVYSLLCDYLSDKESDLVNEINKRINNH